MEVDYSMLYDILSRSENRVDNVNKMIGDLASTMKIVSGTCADQVAKLQQKRLKTTKKAPPCE